MQQERLFSSLATMMIAAVFSVLLLLANNNRVVDGFSSAVQVGRIIPAATASSSSSTRSIISTTPFASPMTLSSSFNIIDTARVTTTTQTTTTTTTTRKTRTQLEMTPPTTIMDMLVNEHTLRIAESWAPIIGILTSTLLYLAPAKAVWNVIQRSRKQKNNKITTTENNSDNNNNNNLMNGLNPLPISIMPAVAVSWFAYGLVSSDPYLILGNLPGLILSIAYLIAILPLMNYNNSNSSNTRQLFLTHATVLVSAATTLGLWATLGLMTAGATNGTNVGIMGFSSMLRSGVIGEALGVYASSLFVILSGSPLSTIRTVLRTKDSQTILGQMTVAQCVNTGLWTAYGLAVHDHFVWGPNIIGLGLGLVQLTLKILFPSKKGAAGGETPLLSSPLVIA